MKLSAYLSGIGLVAIASLALGCSPRGNGGKAPTTPATRSAALATIADEVASAWTSAPSSSSDDEIPSTREAEDALDGHAVSTTTLTSATLPARPKLLLPVELWEHWDHEPPPPLKTWGVSPSDEELQELWGY